MSTPTTNLTNRDVYQRDPAAISLLNNGVAAMTDAASEQERRTLRFELDHFVCAGQYHRGLVRILESYLGHQGRPEQPAAWISGFFGSGKSHLAKMLRFLWTDFTFPEDGATARGVAKLPEDVRDLLTEVSTLGRRGNGLHAAAGTLGAGPGDSVRLALLGIVFKSAGLPASYPQAQFCLWLKRSGIYDQVRSGIEAAGREFRRELNDLYVSPVIARALLAADASFARDERDVRPALRDQYRKPDDITTDQFVDALQETLASGGGALPATAIILDEVQQYIGDDVSLSYVVQEVVEACSKRFGDRLLFVGTGQTSLSGTAALHRLQGRFAVNVELSDADVETVIRRVVLAKRPDRAAAVSAALEASAGEVARHLTGSGIGHRAEDQAILVDDYPLLPVRRRFWEYTLRAVDRAGTAGQLRTQLRIVYDAIRHTAGEPLGSVVPADFLYDELAASLQQSGVLLRELHETIARLRADGAADGGLKARLCALVFLIRKLPREAGADVGVRATAETLADLLVRDLAAEGAALRARLPALLDELAAAGTLLKLDREYGLQTRESSDWEAEFRTRQNRLAGDPTGIGSARSALLGAAVQAAVGRMPLRHGACKEPRKLALHVGSDSPPPADGAIPVWVRDGWGVEESAVLAEARAAGADDPVIHLFLPRSGADALARQIAARGAARETLEYKGVPSTPEGIEARQGMETRLTEAEHNLSAGVAGIVDGAKVLQGGGAERLELSVADKVREAAAASLERLFHRFKDADHHRWAGVIQRARGGAEHPLQALDYAARTEEHPVCAAVLAYVGSGKRGRQVRAQFEAPPYGWPRDAIDGALLSLFGSGHLRATANGVALPPPGLDQAKVPGADFRVEHATVDAPRRLQARKLFQNAGVDYRPNEEVEAAGRLLAKLLQLAEGAGGDAPLPARPATGHLTELQARAGNELLLALLDRGDELAANLAAWTKAGALAAKRLPAFQRLQALAGHAQGLAAAAGAQPQIDAIIDQRRLLDATDPAPRLAADLTDALRGELAQAQTRYDATYDAERQRLEQAASWRQIDPATRSDILGRRRLEPVSAGATGTEQEVLASLDRISLDGWRTRTAALPQLFAEARAEADRLVEPQIRHVQLGGATLRTKEEVRAWIEATERELLSQVEQGPVVID